MFKIGQKVVCVSKDPKHNLIIDKTYTVDRVTNCECGRQNIDVGSPMYYLGVRCISCGCLRETDVQWYSSSRFRPLEYNLCHEELIEKFKSPEEVPDTPIKEPVK